MRIFTGSVTEWLMLTVIQGFPDDWAHNLENPNPTEEDMQFWREVFNTYAELFGKKPKTDMPVPISRSVISISSLLGSGSPDGWLCATITAYAL